MTKSKGVLVTNLGTPLSPEKKDVGTYLREFLGDPFVIDIPAVIRFFLVNLIIVPIRAGKSAAMYKKVWLEDGGSPLLHYTKKIADKLGNKLSGSHEVEVAMRYAQPSIREGLEKLKHLDEIVIVPLYPQYALATFESTIQKVNEEAKKLGIESKVTFQEPYYDDARFIDALHSQTSKSIEELKPDHIIMTYHGLPVRHVRKTENLKPGEKSLCATSGCCHKITERNKDCYRAQCYETSRLLAKRLGLSEDQYTTTFQSRFGKDPWIQPFTDLTLEEFKEKRPDVKKILVISPSFAADCLETLEEVGIGLKEDFESGEDVGRKLIAEPCLNDSDPFVEFLSDRLS